MLQLLQMSRPNQERFDLIMKTETKKKEKPTVKTQNFQKKKLRAVTFGLGLEGLIVVFLKGNLNEDCSSPGELGFFSLQKIT